MMVAEDGRDTGMTAGKARRWRIRGWLLIAVLWSLGTSCSSAEENAHQNHSAKQGENTTPVVLSTLEIPEEFQPGAERFGQFCARCHGERGGGTEQGPPLVHKIYEPSHHADFAFYRAAAQGVRAHHWNFGNMPKIEDATESDVKEIVSYIRWLQRQAGIF